jgi:hypothetical protein
MKKFFWEFLQNWPVLFGFLLGYQYLQAGEFAACVLVVLTGSILGALLIRYTERFMVAGFEESARVTLGNVVVFAGGIGLVLLYFNRAEGNVITDILAGASLGLILSVTQSKAEGEKVSVPHTAAMMLAASAAILGIRHVFLEMPPLTGSAALNIMMTGIIILVEYRQQRGAI